jgi:hypothetical protein
MTLYFQQVCAMGLMRVCSAQQSSDYKLWWRRQESAALLHLCRRLQVVNSCVLCAALVTVLVVGAVGCFDGTSFEGWWHWAYWQSWDWLGVCHCAGAAVLASVAARAYYMSFLLYGTIRDLDTGLIYRGWLRLTTVVNTVIHDVLYPARTQSGADWEARGPWYESAPLHYYELPANWYSYHYYAFD